MINGIENKKKKVYKISLFYPFLSTTDCAQKDYKKSLTSSFKGPAVHVRNMQL